MIQLKTKQPELSGAVMLGDLPNLLHDCVVAHAYQEALREAEVYRASKAITGTSVDERAAELLKEWGIAP